ncbi:MAG TPA: hypothetical protein VM537_25735, partial [Anaerolineae bacterium]|nr:hypothetical protein [Anaerolineae bacterium]
DFPTTTPKAGSTVWEIRLFPLPNKEGSEYLGSGGWRASFSIHIEARRPCGQDSAAELEASTAMSEELLQVMADNREMSIDGEDEAASMVGDLATGKPLAWDYGSAPEGETSMSVVNMTPTWEGPQVTPS